ncbi:hypothetical protein K3495_g6771 [Podosphaera aphanis]|nr:hypothetical protein K3495_g6771 [Podosphaera aphanis]
MNSSVKRLQSSYESLKRTTCQDFAISFVPPGILNDHPFGMTEESEDEQENPLDSYSDLAQKRAHLDQKLKATFESIFEKYGRDFEGIGDEIDIATGEIVVNNGHVLQMQDERDAGDINKLRKNQNRLVNERSDSPKNPFEEKDISCHEDSSSNQTKECRSSYDDNTLSDDDREEDDLILRGLTRVNQFMQLSSEEILQRSQESSYALTTGSGTLQITTPSRASIYTKSFSHLQPSNVNFFAKCYTQRNSYIDSRWQVSNLPGFSDLSFEVQPALKNPNTPPSSVASLTGNSSPLLKPITQLQPSNVKFFTRCYTQQDSYIDSCWQTPNLPGLSNLKTGLSPEAQPDLQNLNTPPASTAGFAGEKSSLKSFSKPNPGYSASKTPLRLEDVDELSLGKNEIKLISSEPKRTPSTMLRKKFIYRSALSSPQFPSSIKSNKRKLSMMNIDDDVDELCIDYMRSSRKQSTSLRVTPSGRSIASDINSITEDKNSILMMAQYSKKKKSIRTYGSRPSL